MNSKRLNMDLSTYDTQTLKDHVTAIDAATEIAVNGYTYSANTVAGAASHVGRNLMLKADIEDELKRRSEIDSQQP